MSIFQAAFFFPNTDFLDSQKSSRLMLHLLPVVQSDALIFIFLPESMLVRSFGSLAFSILCCLLVLYGDVVQGWRREEEKREKGERGGKMGRRRSRGGRRREGGREKRDGGRGRGGGMCVGRRGRGRGRRWWWWCGGGGGGGADEMYDECLSINANART